MDLSLLPECGTVLCAVSGGADSMYLLERLRALGYAVAAAHYDHGLRGEASQADADFVQAYCQSRNIPCVCKAGDVAGYAAKHRLGIEEAARVLRYAFLERAADELGASVIATAHTADDNAETVLLHLLRGTGSRGLGGIPPVRGRIVRPMLQVTRAEVMAWLSSHDVPHVEDASNESDTYARNRIRHHVVPLLRAENPAFAEAVGRMSRLLREEDAFLDGLAADFITAHQLGDSLPAAALAELPAPIARRVIRRMAGDIPLEHTDRVLRLLEKGGREDISGMRVIVSEGRVSFGSDPSLLAERPVRTGEDTPIPEAKLLLRCKKNASVPQDVYKSFNTFFVSCEKIHGNVFVTGRRPGDSYRPAGRGCTKTLKALFLERSIPVWERDRVPVLRDESGILGVYGFPPAEHAAAQPGERDALQIEFLRIDPEKEG